MTRKTLTNPYGHVLKRNGAYLSNDGGFNININNAIIFTDIRQLYDVALNESEAVEVILMETPKEK